MSSAGHILDPVEAAKDDVDRSRRLIAQTLDDLTQHHSWLETYHRDERRRAERLRRQEALERLELKRQRAAFLLRRFAVRSYVFTRAALGFLASKGVAVLASIRTFLRWAAPRASRFAGRTMTQLSATVSSSASRVSAVSRLISAKGYALLERGFLWSVRASEKAGIVFRRKVRRHAFIPAAILGRETALATAPARRRAVILWVRTRRNTRAWTQTRRASLRTWLAATDPSIKAAWRRATRRGAIGWARTRIMTRSLVRRLRRQLAGTETSIKAASRRTAGASAIGWARTRIVTRSLVRRLRRRIAETTDAIKAGWGKHARAATVQLARTSRTAAVLERRAAESVIRTAPRIRRLLKKYTAPPLGMQRTARALIVRPNTALVCPAPARKPLPSLHSA